MSKTYILVLSILILYRMLYFVSILATKYPQNIFNNNIRTVSPLTKSVQPVLASVRHQIIDVHLVFDENAGWWWSVWRLPTSSVLVETFWTGHPKFIHQRKFDRFRALLMRRSTPIPIDGWASFARVCLIMMQHVRWRWQCFLRPIGDHLEFQRCFN